MEFMRSHSLDHGRRLLFVVGAAALLIVTALSLGAARDARSIVHTIAAMATVQAKNREVPLPPLSARLSVEPDAAFTTQYEVAQTSQNGMRIWTVSPRQTPPVGNLLFLHGGAYEYGMDAAHWAYVGWLVDVQHVAVTVPDTPLAPESHVDQVLPDVITTYRSLSEQSDGRPIVVMGDSSGAGIALALAEILRDEHMQQPSRLILLSPWLDVTLTNPDIAAIDPLDPLLSAPDLRQAGLGYAGKRSVMDPEVSPIYGHIRGLPPLSIFAGSHEICVVDARTLASLARSTGVPFDFHEYPDQLHDFMLSQSNPVANQVMESLGTLF